MIPIICIGNYHIDKKIKEMIKICETVDLKTPTNDQIKYIKYFDAKIRDDLKKMVTYIQGDLRKLKSTYDIYRNQESILKPVNTKYVSKKKL